MSLALAGGKHGGYGGHGDRKGYHGGSSGYKSGKGSHGYSRGYGGKRF